ncbi:bifunctional [glutamate--ammonia ligase]-adenylyl-L-tyrosine phosphorylase/[glutamate--ammonia-ligase] adenylyltransferase [uncultured Erythrobacter sp.]|uniref:bifunctional [glutamate--ammonia ligase]-adenylyl-L-tyrosine phosphorylase/[glutamate--ammonia-ligase] adenylyltransferase n=1 Tax=uncultured Erythrobacter sp. TaxID=263913 RepID=UPI0026270250|nr:bifunctional [glutamate--ammonia ligase]-adenylyl-L-tyrosine phosphorylase/[glutamate--ammonia-ligase] adenylyltransferase [uncultured Erythrobacter sp.]
MATTAQPDWNRALERARENAPFLARTLDRQPELAELLAAGDVEAAFEWTRLRGQHDDAGVALRRERLALATTVAIADLAGAFTLDRVVQELTSFADRALDRAIRTAIAERSGEDSADGFIALALGKQGAGELNYSSDIDPILLYDPETLPRRATDDPGDAAQRYARRIVKLLSENTAEGYVLRVDLRLRPASEISPLVVPRASALSHYQGAALAWERAAFTRARAAAGDISAGEAFLDAIRPFVWRGHLDFGAIEEIRALTARIRDNHDGPTSPGPGFDVKRGRGGIREIEFFAQTHQLIHGGRDPSLRVRRTRSALDALAAAGQIKLDEARILGESYDRLRTIEHRLQMINDRQTHSLPDGDALDAVARLDGLANGAALIQELVEITERSGQIYEQLVGAKPTLPQSSRETTEFAERLKQLGFERPRRLATRIEGWRDGRFQSLRSPQALEAFDRLLPALLKAMAASDDPDRALTRWESVLERAPSAIALFRLLDARPELLDRLIAALTLAPMLSDEIGRRPELLDTLLDLQPLSFPVSVTEIVERMENGAERDDYEAQLDCIRRVTGEERLELGLRLIEAEYPPQSIAQALSATAEAAIVVAAKAAQTEFARNHGHIEGSELVVLGLGRLGGEALTHASDLDMIYLFTGDYSAESDGRRPLGGTLYFNRLATRVSGALSVPTAQGPLYEVDTRLRPQGNQGPLAVSVEAFAKYQRESAWTWEHMALARARVIVGSDAARAELTKVMAGVLAQERDADALRNAVLTMRGEIAAHKPMRGELDVKLARGGLVDVEFLVHFVQLREAKNLSVSRPDAMSPNLSVAIGNLVERGLLPADFAQAHDLLTDLLVAGRLLAPDGVEPPPAAANALARACRRESFAELTQDLAVSRACVAAAWADIFDQQLELE